MLVVYTRNVPSRQNSYMYFRHDDLVGVSVSRRIPGNDIAFNSLSKQLWHYGARRIRKNHSHSSSENYYTRLLFQVGIGSFTC